MLHFDWLRTSVLFAHSNLFSSFKENLPIFHHCREFASNTMEFAILAWEISQSYDWYFSQLLFHKMIYLFNMFDMYAILCFFVTCLYVFFSD